MLDFDVESSAGSSADKCVRQCTRRTAWPFGPRFDPRLPAVREPLEAGGATQKSDVVWEVWVKRRLRDGSDLTGFGGFGKICVHKNRYRSPVATSAHF